jgi:putative ABC transport system permease protein
MLMLAAFAGVALGLGAIGIYGVMAYSVSQQTREIGIRMALGAPASKVLTMVMGRGMLLAFSGVAIGLIGAGCLTQLMSTILFGVTATDPLIFASVALLLISVAIIASYIPSRRATRIDPTVALKYE